MSPLISVIIPHLNQPQALEACLRNLKAQSIEPHLFEVIVVDNGSTICPREIVGRHHGVRLLSENQPGPGLARNTGAKSANGKILAFIDADCRAHPDWLCAIQQALESGTSRHHSRRRRPDLARRKSSVDRDRGLRKRLRLSVQTLYRAAWLLGHWQYGNIPRRFRRWSAHSRASMWPKIWTGENAPARPAYDFASYPK